jgi:glycosyltransferase involved in cell wall biosynthesis
MSALVHLHVTSAGNEFMAHIAGLFAEGFRTQGVAAEVIVDGLPLEDLQHGALSVVVAPHEYFPLHFLRTRPTIELEPTLASVAVLNVEQPGSEWYEAGWEFARRARLVFDISPAGVAEFERRCVPAVLAPLGYTPSLQAPTCLRTADRAIDVLFLGHASPRRTAFFARHAEFFSAFNCHIVVSEVDRPRLDGAPGYRSGDQRLQLVASSRIVLCVHSTDRPYFEQHRAMLALANGCLLVTETSRHVEPLESGVHFVSAELDELPEVCRRYLGDAPALEKLAGAGRDLAASRMQIRQSCAVMLDALGRTDGRTSATERDADTVAREQVRTRLAESQARLAAGQTPWTTTANAAYATATPPALTVLITLFNYSRYVRQCLDSVLGATPPAGGLEIVVVDDGSSDGGADLVAAVMAAVSTPMLLVRKALNSGLADARNVGLTLARGRQFFVLDADNWIYPPCLTVLQAAIDEGGLAATYGLIARIEEQTGEGIDLVSSLDWSPRRLIEGPYIDAMALFDRQAVLDVGGYSTELIEHGWFGWEDYDLWLKLAQAGKSCRLVPRIVAGYREHGASMLRRTNRSAERLARYFTTKFADLVSRHPGLDTRFSFPSTDEEQTTPEQAQIRRLSEHTVALERQLADVYASKSWQMTSPLRTALGWLGKRDRT